MACVRCGFGMTWVSNVLVVVLMTQGVVKGM